MNVELTLSSLRSSSERPALAMLLFSVLVCCLGELALIARVLEDGERRRTHALWGTWLAIVAPLAVGGQLMYVTHAARVAELTSASVSDGALRAAWIARAVEEAYLGRVLAGFAWVVTGITGCLSAVAWRSRPMAAVTALGLNLSAAVFGAGQALRALAAGEPCLHCSAQARLAFVGTRLAETLPWLRASLWLSLAIACATGATLAALAHRTRPARPSPLVWCCAFLLFMLGATCLALMRA